MLREKKENYFIFLLCFMSHTSWYSGLTLGAILNLQIVLKRPYGML